MSRAVLALVAVLGLSTYFGIMPPAPASSDADIANGRAILHQGDALADKGDIKGAEVHYVRGFELVLGALRDLPFKHPVKYRVITPAAAARDLSPGDSISGEIGMKALGLLPRSANLKQIVTGVREEQVAAYYNERTKTMSLIVDPRKAKTPPSFLERMTGQKTSFSKSETRTVIAHELTHALMDQHYQLALLEAKARGDDDRDYALHALAEGDATLSMMLVNSPQLGSDQVARFESTVEIVAPYITLFAGGSLGSAPAVVRDTTVFPYLDGIAFCAHLFDRGGWQAINRAYTQPPISTSEILHPDLYTDGGPGPLSIHTGRLTAGPEWSLADHNDVGELQIGILLRNYDGKQAATGWNGDSFDAFTGPGGKIGLAWLTTWNSEDDAAYFAQHYALFQSARFKLAGAPSASETAVRPPPGRLLRGRNGAWYAVERRGVNVAIAEGFGRPVVKRLLDELFHAKMSPKRYGSTVQ